MLFRAFRSGHGAKTSLARQLVSQTACEAMLCKNNQPVRHFCVKSANPHGCDVYFGKNGQNQTQSEHTLRHFWPLALKSAVRYARRLGSGLRGGPSGPTNLRRPVGLPPRFVFKNAPRASGEDRCAISRCRFFDRCRVQRLTHRFSFVHKTSGPPNLRRYLGGSLRGGICGRVLDGPVLNRTAPCFQSETEGVVSSRGLLLGGRHVVHVSPSLGCRQSRALVGERLGRADSSHRRQRRPFGCATSPYSSTMAPQSVGCPILSQSWCLKLVFFCKNAVRISHPFFWPRFRGRL